MAGTTRLELATSAVTGQRSNQLNYVPAVLRYFCCEWWALSDLNGRPFGCKPNALTAELSALHNSSYRKLFRPSTQPEPLQCIFLQMRRLALGLGCQ